jgi:hypothetical protein
LVFDARLEFWLVRLMALFLSDDYLIVSVIPLDIPGNGTVAAVFIPEIFDLPRIPVFLTIKLNVTSPGRILNQFFENRMLDKIRIADSDSNPF